MFFNKISHVFYIIKVQRKTVRQLPHGLLYVMS